MPSQYQPSFQLMQRKESDSELGEVPLYGPTRYCSGSCNPKERD